MARSAICLAAGALAASVAAAAAAPTSFSCAISTVTLKAGEPELDVCTCVGRRADER